MQLRNAAAIVASGTSGFLIAGVLATELAAPHIEFSLFVGLPVGLVAGIAVAALVATGLRPAASPGRRRPALTAGTFGVVFLAILGVAGGLGIGTVLALVVASVVGTLAAVSAYWRFDRRQLGAVATDTW